MVRTNCQLPIVVSLNLTFFSLVLTRFNATLQSYRIRFLFSRDLYSRCGYSINFFFISLLRINRRKVVVLILMDLFGYKLRLLFIRNDRSSNWLEVCIV